MKSTDTQQKLMPCTFSDYVRVILDSAHKIVKTRLILKKKANLNL